MAKYAEVGLGCGNFPSHDIGEKIFGGENTVQSQMTVEAALARVQASLGIIPAGAAEEINKKCDVNLIDEAEYERQYKITNHPLMCLIRTYSAICDGDAGEYIHYGTTTQDIIDTARVLQLKQAYDIILSKTISLKEQIAEKAIKYKSLVMMGRTNDQHALPITLGFKMATWVDELSRSVERFETSRERIFVGQFFGAVGTLASLEEKGIEINNGLMKELGLNTADIMWFTSRDRWCEMISNLCILTGTLGRIADEVYMEQKSEVNELAEGFKPGRVGSSTMPHKRNPFVPGAIVGYARLSRSVMVDALGSMEGSAERDVRTIGMENEYLARAFTLADAALDQTADLMEYLEVHERNIKKNLELSGGLIFAEAIMMRLAEGMGRLNAHEVVYELAQQAISEDKSFRSLLLTDERTSAFLTAGDLDDIMDPASYIGLAEYFTEKVAGK